MDRNKERSILLKKRESLKLQKMSINSAFKVVDTVTGEVSSFYSLSFANEEAKKRANQKQCDFARRRIILKSNTEK